MLQSLERLKAKLTGTTLIGPDGFPLAADDPAASWHHLLSELLEQAADATQPYDVINLSQTEQGRKLTSLNPEDAALVIGALADRMFALDEKMVQRRAEAVGGFKREDVRLWQLQTGLGRLLGEFLRRKLKLDPETLTRLVEGLAFDPLVFHRKPASGIVRAIESFAAERDLPQLLRSSLNRLRNSLRGSGSTADLRRLAVRIDRLVDDAAEIPLAAGEAWSDQALSDLQEMSAGKRAAWLALLLHCQTGSGSVPTARWTKQAGLLLAGVAPDFGSTVSCWFALVDKPRTQRIEDWNPHLPDPNNLIVEKHADILKGLAWCCALSDSGELARALTTLALSAFRKIPAVGPRCARLGNACVHALGAMPGHEGVAQLAIVGVRVRTAATQKTIDKALAGASERIGLSRQEIEEMSVPTYGLTDVGRRSEELGPYTAELRVVGSSATEIRWFQAGVTQKSVPSAVKSDFPETLSELKRAATDIQKMLPAQRERLERLLLSPQSRNFASWRRNYLDHPLVGCLARRLIWRFRNGEEQVDAIFHQGNLVGLNGRAISPAEATTVTLWHPIGDGLEQVLAWRRWLQEQELTQPFKQAHREVYILTDAERATRTHSNRFAAHIIKQHQYNALCAARGWRYALRGGWDQPDTTATRLLPDWHLRAELWTDPAGDDLAASGVYLYLAADQVRFYRLDEESDPNRRWERGARTVQPVPLEEIPPVVLSEILRDVDLFVSVCSIGNDPNWTDGGAEGRYRQYWDTFSFGELGATAITRRDTLAVLLPRLKVASRCSIDDRFLVVRGDLHTYKIHLGSGNIMMQPGDRYLCIVRAPEARGTSAERIFLPFDGDATLTLILSKALLLANDKAIQDPAIVSQIGTGRR